jgi:hypothetical protein
MELCGSDAFIVLDDADLLGGKRLERRAYFLEPTMLTDIAPKK